VHRELNKKSGLELVQIGKSMIFFKEDYKLLLDEVLNRNRLNDVKKIQKQAKKFLINRKIKKAIAEINNRVEIRRKKREEELRLQREEQMRKEKEEREKQRQLEREKLGVSGGMMGRTSNAGINPVQPNTLIHLKKETRLSTVDDADDDSSDFDREKDTQMNRIVKESLNEGIQDMKKIIK